MFVLGNTSDDKGTQLEQLTLKLLQKLGYLNCTTNFVSSGGTEVDVSGEYEIPHPNHHVIREIVCECKAHRRPVGIPDWQKFLGKVFSEEVLRGHEVGGVFVALSGVNGNVKGHFDSLRSRRDNISIITGDDLFRHLQDIFGIIAFEDVTRQVSQKTSKVVRQVEPVYYERECYWLIVFVDGEFTLLSADGAELAHSTASIFQSLVGKEVEVNRYVELAEEAHALRRANAAKTWCLGRLMLSGGAMRRADMISSATEYSTAEVSIQLEELRNEGVVVFDTPREGDASIPVGKRVGAPHVAASVYQALFVGGVPLAALGCPFYDTHINEALVDEILSIQHDVPLSEEDVCRAIQLLRLSPSALQCLTKPIAFITTHRKEKLAEKGERGIDKMDRDYLFQQMHELLWKDFMVGPLAAYFFDIRNTRELETKKQVRVKSVESVEIDDIVFERLAIGQASEELGGGFVHIQLLPGTPEPWEEGGMGRQKPK